jgi:iron(III) transport system permease protein
MLMPSRTGEIARSWALFRRPVDGFSIFTGLVSITVLCLVIYPLVRVVFVTFVPDGVFDLNVFREAFGQSQLGTVLFNTAGVVVGATLIAVIIGSTFAWLNERTDIGMNWMSRVLPVVPLLVPPIAGTIGWVLLAAPRSGFLNGLIRQGLNFFGYEIFEGPLNIFSWPGLVFVYVLYLVPYVYLTVAASLQNIDPALEEASRVSGSGVWATLFNVTLPSIKPAIAAGTVLALITGFSLFSVPVIIGGQADIEVLAVRIVHLMTASYPPKTGVALVLSTLIIAFVGLAWWMQARMVLRKHYATIGGRGIRATEVRLGRWRWLARWTMLAYLLMTSVLPLLGLILVSLQPFWSASVSLEMLSFENYQRIFSGGSTQTALRNSVLLGIVGATVGMLVASFVTVFIARNRGWWLSNLIDGTTKLPGAVSHLVIGIAFIGAFAGPPFYLHGTIAILFLAYIVLYIPQATFSAASALAQVGDQLSEASLVSGASQTQTFFRITLPLMLPGLAAGWTMLFVLIAGDITASSMLAGTRNPVSGFVILDLWVNGSFPDLAALGTVISLMTSTVVLATLRLARISR